MWIPKLILTFFFLCSFQSFSQEIHFEAHQIVEGKIKVGDNVKHLCSRYINYQLDGLYPEIISAIETSSNESDLFYLYKLGMIHSSELGSLVLFENIKERLVESKFFKSDFYGPKLRMYFAIGYGKLFFTSRALEYSYTAMDYLEKSDDEDLDVYYLMHADYLLLNTKNSEASEAIERSIQLHKSKKSRRHSEKNDLYNFYLAKSQCFYFNKTQNFKASKLSLQELKEISKNKTFENYKYFTYLALLHEVKILERFGEIDRALEQSELLLQMFENFYPKYRIIFFKKIARLHSKNGNYQKAYETFFKMYELSKRHNASEVRQIEESFKVLNKKIQTKNEILLRQKKIELNNQKSLTKKNKMISLLWMFTCFVLIILGFLYLRHKKIKLKLANQHLIAKSLEYNLDLTKADLASISMQLASKNKLIGSVKKSLKSNKDEFSGQSLSVVNKIISNVNVNSQDQLWKEFEMRFAELNSTFFENLLSKHPNLTKNEKRLCSFLKLNMSIKEISATTGQSTNSIKVARKRLRNKLGITQQEITLHDYLGQF